MSNIIQRFLDMFREEELYRTGSPQYNRVGAIVEHEGKRYRVSHTFEDPYDKYHWWIVYGVRID